MLMSIRAFIYMIPVVISPVVHVSKPVHNTLKRAAEDINGPNSRGVTPYMTSSPHGNIYCRLRYTRLKNRTQFACIRNKTLRNRVAYFKHCEFYDIARRGSIVNKSAISVYKSRGRLVSGLHSENNLVLLSVIPNLLRTIFSTYAYFKVRNVYASILNTKRSYQLNQYIKYTQTL